MSETKTVLELIATERKRQIAKGWTPEHDDNEHSNGWLGKIASKVAFGTECRCDDSVSLHIIRKHPRVEQLVIAAAMLVAEIERLQRSGESNSPVIPDGSNPNL